MKKKQKSGISLIVLVITIIVIIILAVAVILSIANNNPIENANKAKFQSDLKTIQEELTLKQTSNYIDKNTGKKTSEITITDLPSAESYMKANKLLVKDGKLCYITDGVTDSEKTWAEEVGLKSAGTLLTFTGDSGNGLKNNNGTLEGSYGGEETDIIIPNSVTSIGDYAFSGCMSLTSITIPNSVTSIGDGVFGGCDSLNSITISKSVINIGNGAFEGCNSLKSITIPKSVKSIGNNAFLSSYIDNIILEEGSTLDYNSKAADWGIKKILSKDTSTGNTVLNVETY